MSGEEEEILLKRIPSSLLHPTSTDIPYDTNSCFHS